MSSFLDAETLQGLCVQYGYAAVVECAPCPNNPPSTTPYPPADRFYAQLWGAGALLYLIGYLSHVLQALLCARPAVVSVESPKKLQ